MDKPSAPRIEPAKNVDDAAPDYSAPGVAPEYKNVTAENTEGAQEKRLLESSSKGAKLSEADQKALDEQNPPAPKVGPDVVSDLYESPGGYQVVPHGVKPEDVGATAINRA